MPHFIMFCFQLTMLVMGVPVGYSSANTMTDLSTAIKRGDKGDVTLLQPTLICSVPLVLIRIQKVRKEKKDFYERLEITTSIFVEPS